MGWYKLLVELYILGSKGHAESSMQYFDIVEIVDEVFGIVDRDAMSEGPKQRELKSDDTTSVLGDGHDNNPDRQQT